MPGLSFIDDFAAALSSLRGWRRNLVSILLGALAALALPPLHFFPVLFVSFPGLLWLTAGASRLGQAFALGWWFGLGHFAAGLYWISIALLTEPEKYGWMVPFAVLGMAALLGVFTGLATLGTYVSGGRKFAGVLIFALCWTAGEWLRGHVLTGFPWNLMGSALTFSDGLIQLAAATGAWGLSLLAVFVASMPVVLAGTFRVRHPLRPIGLALGLLGLVWILGTWRLPGAGEEDNVPGVTLRLVQANIDQSHKWDPSRRLAHFEKYLSLSAYSQTPVGGKGKASEVFPTHVIWPETAAPYFLNQDDGARKRIAAVPGGLKNPRPNNVSAEKEPLPQGSLRNEAGGGLIITGAPRSSPADVSPRQVWNSVFAIDRWGTIVEAYDKFHLVPFGEYVPFRGLLPLTKITQGRLDFSSGPGPRTLTLPGLPPVSPLICYEAIFPGDVVSSQVPASWLLNVTNDAWFGHSSGPYQHFESARLRAVEEGLPLVRAANTGISAVVDPYGQIVAALGLGKTGIVDSPLPLALSGGTLYGKYKDLIFFVLFVLCGLLAKKTLRF